MNEFRCILHRIVINKPLNIMFSLLIISILASILAPQVQGAIIHGTVYDYNLNKIDNVQVVLGGEKTITEDGAYRFYVSPGEYTLEARRIDRFGNLISSTSDNITVREDKEYVLDLILIEAIDIGDDIDTSINDTIDQGINSDNARNELGVRFWVIAIIFILIILSVIIVLFINHFKKELTKVEKTTHEKIKQTEQKIKTTEKKLEKTEENLPKDAKEVLAFIKSRDGRSTQLEIRERFPSSEAKISLIISELEHKGKIQKIKKGRGNIIILK